MPPVEVTWRHEMIAGLRALIPSVKGRDLGTVEFKDGADNPIAGIAPWVYTYPGDYAIRFMTEGDAGVWIVTYADYLYDRLPPQDEGEAHGA